MKDIRESGEKEALRKKVVSLGEEYSLVTDYTSMLVISETEMEGLGIDHKNANRVNDERKAQQCKQSRPATNYRVDNSSGDGGAFNGKKSPGIGTGTGAGAVGPAFLMLVMWLKRKRKQM